MNSHRYKAPRLLHPLVVISGWFGLTALCILLSGSGFLVPAATASRQPSPARETDHCLTTPRSGGVEPGYRRSFADYQPPNLYLMAMDGSEIPTDEIFDAGRPVMLNFIFTSCSTICPVLSASFAQVRALLGNDASQLRFVSISIDPEHDTPATLQRYAQRYHADGSWRFLTGSRDDIVAVQRAFDAYRGNKSSHQPLTFLRSHGGAPWLRIEGFPKAEDLVDEYRRLLDAKSTPDTSG